MRSLSKILLTLNDYQEDILLVYHPEVDSYWNDRCYFLKEGYSPHKAYNHRAVLDNEIVIEYDFPDKEKNKHWVNYASKKLRADGVQHSVWFSGGKSYHLHFFIKMPPDVNPVSLKRFLVKHYNNPFVPDLTLCNNNHLIRAEFGVHEKTGGLKLPYYDKGNPYALNIIKEELLEQFKGWVEKYPPKVLTEESAEEINSQLLQDPFVKYLLDPYRFRSLRDGKKRALFCLVHVLKTEYPKDAVIKRLEAWYSTLGGDYRRVRGLVDYQWDKTYVVSRQLKDLKEELQVTL